MPGKLIWLVGPSGSGKDSLLAARCASASTRSCWWPIVT